MPPKPAPEQSEPPEQGDPPAEKSATIEDVNRVVTEALEPFRKLLGGGGPEQDEEPDDEPAPAARGKRRTFRDMEEEMEDLVTQKVKDLLKREKSQGENHPEPGEEKAPPEPIPASPPQRRVERALWGSDAR